MVIHRGFFIYCTSIDVIPMIKDKEKAIFIRSLHFVRDDENQNKMLDIILIVLAALVMIVGIVGCILPVIPGPPLAFVAILIAQQTEYIQLSSGTMWSLFLLALVVQALDYVVPIWGTKKFGGSKAGVWGSTIGLIVGVIVLPFLGIVLGPFGILGILAGPFFGALVGELSVGKESEAAFKAALGSFIGFLTGTLMKLVASFVMLYFLIKAFF
jgi:uncharacterized protein YqgC (DUF456 family)